MYGSCCFSAFVVSGASFFICSACMMIFWSRQHTPARLHGSPKVCNALYRLDLRGARAGAWNDKRKRCGGGRPCVFAVSFRWVAFDYLLCCLRSEVFTVRVLPSICVILTENLVQRFFAKKKFDTGVSDKCFYSAWKINKICLIWLYSIYWLHFYLQRVIDIGFLVKLRQICSVFS